VDSSIRSLGLPVLKPLSPLSTAAREYPIVLLAHGLKRAYLVADQLVWRLPADVVTVSDAPLAEAVAVLETEEGDHYHLVDPGRLLENVQDPSYPVRRFEPPREPVTPPPPPVNVSPPAPAPEPATAPEPAPAPEPEPAPAPPPASPAAPAVATAPAEPEPVTPPAPPPSPRTLIRRVLLADDSVAARITLSRMLEARGYEVTPVATAHELVEMLGAGPWDAVFIDIELPDARGRGLFDIVQRRARSVAGNLPLIAVVRDRGERDLADKAGLASIDKPFRTPQVDELLRALREASR
jgi:CheY-like chemotaxis protein